MGCGVVQGRGSAPYGSGWIPAPGDTETIQVLSVPPHQGGDADQGGAARQRQGGGDAG